ncbi:hypothetical protein ACFVQB_14335 [Paenibacillus sp. NPDC057886]|uniref:hypothetical protein n=1 Tax=Paenibacillus sp. NPDC057886 TaxID=3346270 RepID=UPI0036BB4F4B
MVGYVIKYSNGDYVTSIDYSLEFDRSARWQEAEIFDDFIKASELAATIPNCSVLVWSISEGQ